MRRPVKSVLWVTGVFLLLVVLGIATVMVAGNTDAGRSMIERVTERLTGGQVKLSGLGGSLPSQLTLQQLQLIDSKGIWLTADDVSLRWTPLRLLERRIVGESLHVARLNFERTPVSQSSGGSASVPDIEIGHFAIDSLQLGADLTGTPTVLAAQGSLHLRSLQDADANVEAHRSGSEGDYSLRLHFDSARMDATLAVSEPANGPLQNLATLPGLGALSVQLTLKGLRAAEQVNAEVTAGALKAHVQGTVDLLHSAADLDYTIDSAAMAPRADFSWARIALHGNWHGALKSPSASGKLEIERMVIAGDTKIAKLSADLVAANGTVGLKALVQGLEIPGPEPRLLANDPLSLSASMLTSASSRPLELSATHRLLTLRSTIITAGDQQANFDLRLPDLAPLARIAAQDVRGNALFKGQIKRNGDEATLALNATVGLKGGSASWLGIAGPRATAEIAATLSSDTFSVQNLKVEGRALTLTANGSAGRVLPHPLQARWQLTIPDLSALATALAGKFQLAGTLKGVPSSMTSDATLTTDLSVRGSPMGAVEAVLHARGLPSSPSATLEAHGTLDAAPLKIDVAVDRTAGGSFRALVHQAQWKSARVDGDLSVNSGLTESHGQLGLHVAQLGDFDRLLGIQIAGSVEGTLGFDPTAGQPHARLKLDASHLSYGELASGGEIHLQAAGPADALNIDLSANLQQLYGKPAKLSAAALLDLHHSTLRFASAATDYRGGSVRLLEPAQLSFASGFSVDILRLGSQDAVLQLQGELAPELDLSASLKHVSPGLVNTYFPALLEGGALEAQVRLQGTLDAPTGTLKIDATKITFADDAATGLPPADLHGSAQLHGESASVDIALAAGGSSQLKLSGTAPLSPDGALDLKIGGKLDVGLANPLLEARGLHATGELNVDASIGGTVGAPQVGGGVSLTSGSLRDYGRGIYLSDITAQAVGSEGTLQIQSFKATAASGSVSVAGSVGVLQANMPVDLKITAKNAQPIASNIVTANLDADIHVIGTARKRLDVTGTIHLIHAVIGIPNSLPPDVAVLDVRRRGQAPIQDDQQLVIGLDVSIHAPADILVQGRGLDAEMGGDLHIRGTTDDPTVGGGFDLQRGSFTLGTKLNFPSGYAQRVSFDSAGLRKKIDPTLDFTAQAVFGENTISVHISGAADAPRFDLSSSTGQAQDEIMAMLLFNGESAASITALQAAQIAATLATLSGVGSGGGPNPLVRLQRSLGLDRLNVGSNTTTTATGATESAGAAIEAGRYVSKRVYIEGKQTTTGTSQVQVDVDLTKHLKLQTRLGNGTATTQGTTPENDPGSSVGLSYQFEY